MKRSVTDTPAPKSGQCVSQQAKGPGLEPSGEMILSGTEQRLCSPWRLQPCKYRTRDRLPKEMLGPADSGGAGATLDMGRCPFFPKGPISTPDSPVMGPCFPPGSAKIQVHYCEIRSMIRSLHYFSLTKTSGHQPRTLIGPSG